MILFQVLEQKLIDKGLAKLLEPGGMFDKQELQKLSPETRDALSKSKLNLGKFVSNQNYDSLMEFFMSYIIAKKPNLCVNGTLPDFIELPDDSKRPAVRNLIKSSELKSQRIRNATLF